MSPSAASQRCSCFFIFNFPGQLTYCNKVQRDFPALKHTRVHAAIRDHVRLWASACFFMLLLALLTQKIMAAAPDSITC